ncbi:hypothetical protein [Nocardia pseudovaccinii]|nr:hypothetical protein [Nocardia pseudovaccinii]
MITYSRTEISLLTDADLGTAIIDALNSDDAEQQEALLREHDLRAVEW